MIYVAKITTLFLNNVENESINIILDISLKIYDAQYNIMRCSENILFFYIYRYYYGIIVIYLVDRFAALPMDVFFYLLIFYFSYNPFLNI